MIDKSARHGDEVAASNREAELLKWARGFVTEHQSHDESSRQVEDRLAHEGRVENRVAMAEITANLSELTAIVSRNEIMLKASLGERDFYQSLFRHDKRSLVVTSNRGVIREASDSAAQLVSVPRRFLDGRALIGFVARGACREFRELLSGAGTARRSGELLLRRRNGGGIVAVRAHVGACEAANLLWELEPLG